jgi:hypothetical protein
MLVISRGAESWCWLGLLRLDLEQHDKYLRVCLVAMRIVYVIL